MVQKKNHLLGICFLMVSVGPLEDLRDAGSLNASRMVIGITIRGLLLKSTIILNSLKIYRFTLAFG